MLLGRSRLPIHTLLYLAISGLTTAMCGTVNAIVVIETEFRHVKEETKIRFSNLYLGTPYLSTVNWLCFR